MMYDTESHFKVIQRYRKLAEAARAKDCRLVEGPKQFQLRLGDHVLVESDYLVALENMLAGIRKQPLDELVRDQQNGG